MEGQVHLWNSAVPKDQWPDLLAQRVARRADGDPQWDRYGAAHPSDEVYVPSNEGARSSAWLGCPRRSRSHPGRAEESVAVTVGPSLDEPGRADLTEEEEQSFHSAAGTDEVEADPG